MAVLTSPAVARSAAPKLLVPGDAAKNLDPWPHARLHVVQFSGGIASWAAAQRVASRHGSENLILLIADTHAEDPDLWRFADDAAWRLGVRLTRIEDGRDPWTVFFHEGFLGNSHIAPCSKHLKQIPARRWMQDHTDPRDCVIYIGIDWTEMHRIPAIEAHWAPWPVRFPLTLPPYWSKDKFLQMARQRGIEPPRLYGLGFQHNNCGGACVRAGAAAWAHLLRVFPDRFAKAEANEELFRAKHGNFTILKSRTRGETEPLTLRELREGIEAGTRRTRTRRTVSGLVQGDLIDEFETDPLMAVESAYDADDWGGCGCMTTFGDAAP